MNEEEKIEPKEVEMNEPEKEPSEMVVHEADFEGSGEHQDGEDYEFHVVATRDGGDGALGHYVIKSITDMSKPDEEEKGDYQGMIRKQGIPPKYT